MTTAWLGEPRTALPVGSLRLASANDTIESLYEQLSVKLQGRRVPSGARHESQDAQNSLPDDSGGPMSRLELSPTLPVPLSYYGD